MATKIVSTFAEALADAKKNMLKASIATVNIVAANARKFSQENITRSFTTRNNFTVNSVRFTQCPKSVTRLADVRSEMGITEKAGYMARQETGGTKRAPSGKNLIIPNTRARGGSNKNKVKSKYFYKNIKQNFKARQDSSKIALAIAAKNASMVTGGGFIRINDTIFQVTKFMKKNDNRMFISKPILNLSRLSVQLEERPWLLPASAQAAEQMQKIFNSEMNKL